MKNDSFEFTKEMMDGLVVDRKNISIRTYDEVKMIIKDIIWDFKQTRKVLTVKNIYDASEGKIKFEELPYIGKYLESVRHRFLTREINGYLELHWFEKFNAKDLVNII